MPGLARFWRDAALPFAESRRAIDSRACYRPHSHATLSIGAVDAGRSRFSGAGSQDQWLAPGCLVIVAAGQVHACNPPPGQPWSYQMLHLEAAWAQRHGWRAQGARILNDPASYRYFCRVNRLLFSDAAPTRKTDALIVLLARLADAPAHELPGPPDSATLDPLLSALRAQAGDYPTLPDLAALGGMSQFQLIRAFRRLTGLPPHAWMLDQRVIVAREWLRAGQPLAEIAQDLGFADQSHFQRVFKAHTAVTPGQYRA